MRLGVGPVGGFAPGQHRCPLLRKHFRRAELHPHRLIEKILEAEEGLALLVRSQGGRLGPDLLHRRWPRSVLPGRDGVEADQSGEQQARGGCRFLQLDH